MLYNFPHYKKLRKLLRNNATPAERVLWRHLSNSKFQGCKFRRQQGIGRYVVDFYCPRLHLAVEIDGDTHSTPEAKRYDEERTAWLDAHYVHVVRFMNQDVFENIEGVLETLRWEAFILESKKDHPQPLLN